jgi:adenine-specific DNA-methyltransferase
MDKTDLVTKYLGEPFYRVDNCLIYNMDCLTGLRELPLNIVNLTVTSPPYNIGKEYEESRDVSCYLNWCEQWINEIYRVTHQEGSFWLNLGYISLAERAKAIPISYLLWDKIPFYLVQEIVWHYGAGVAGRKFFSPRNEKFLWYVKNADKYTFNLDEVRDPNVKYPNQKKNGKIKVNPIGKNPSDVWEIPKVTSGYQRASKERTRHPAQFPESVITRVVKVSSNPCEIVLDPFMGSGTTAVVALREKRFVVGFELRTDYCYLAVERINAFLNQQKESSMQKELFSAIDYSSD